MKFLAIILFAIALVVLPGCATEETVTSETTVTTEETAVHTPAVSETRTIRSY
jgi:outer membrane biogenesis lipoprotein LolB